MKSGNVADQHMGKLHPLDHTKTPPINSYIMTSLGAKSYKLSNRLLFPNTAFSPHSQKIQDIMIIQFPLVPYFYTIKGPFGNYYS